MARFTDELIALLNAHGSDWEIRPIPGAAAWVASSRPEPGQTATRDVVGFTLPELHRKLDQIRAENEGDRDTDGRRAGPGSGSPAEP